MESLKLWVIMRGFLWIQRESSGSFCSIQLLSTRCPSQFYRKSAHKPSK